MDRTFQPLNFKSTPWKTTHPLISIRALWKTLKLTQGGLQYRFCWSPEPNWLSFSMSSGERSIMFWLEAILVGLTDLGRTDAYAISLMLLLKGMGTYRRCLGSRGTTRGWFRVPRHSSWRSRGRRLPSSRASPKNREGNRPRRRCCKVA